MTDHGGPELAEPAAIDLARTPDTSPDTQAQPTPTPQGPGAQPTTQLSDAISRVRRSVSTARGAPSSPRVQRRLTVGASADPLETEADRVADAVVSRLVQNVAADPISGPSRPSRQEAVTRSGPRVQRFYAVKDAKNTKAHPAAGTGRIDALDMDWIKLPDPRDDAEYPDTVANTGWWAHNLYRRRAAASPEATPSSPRVDPAPGKAEERPAGAKGKKAAGEPKSEYQPSAAAVPIQAKFRTDPKGPKGSNQKKEANKLKARLAKLTNETESAWLSDVEKWYGTTASKTAKKRAKQKKAGAAAHAARREEAAAGKVEEEEVTPDVYVDRGLNAVDIFRGPWSGATTQAIYQGSGKFAKGGSKPMVVIPCNGQVGASQVPGEIHVHLDPEQTTGSKRTRAYTHFEAHFKDAAGERHGRVEGAISDHPRLAALLTSEMPNWQLVSTWRILLDTNNAQYNARQKKRTEDGY